MSDVFNIEYKAYHELDFVKWDNCIAGSSNGLIYGYSWWLDRMARQWDALVLNDYEAVMPLTWHKKFGITYLYQPFVTAQLGIFGNHPGAALVESFLQAIPSKFQYWDFNLNHQNMFHLKQFELHQRKNFVLNLESSYDDIYKGYRENIKRNIRRAENLGCKPFVGFDVEKMIALVVEQMKTFTRDEDGNMGRFREIYNYLHRRQQSNTYGILSKKGELIASCVFVYSHNRAYYILVGNHPDGRTIGASHMLVDAFIKDNAQKKLLLDFEGSDIPGLAFFYSSFGAQEENYAAIRLNRLPWYLKWLKA